MRRTNCGFCSKAFPARQGKRFCSDTCRYNAWVASLRTDAIPNACTYCGTPADTIDHIPPQSIRPVILSNPDMLAAMKFLEVPACRECNSALGSRPLWTVPERKDFVKQWLRRRYRSALAMKPWTAEEKTELGENMRREIERGAIVREWVRRRLEW